MKKVLIVGAGNVGAHIIHHGITKNMGAEFFLVDINEELEKAQILDLKDTLLFSEYAKVEGIDFGDPRIGEMDIIVITAGANQLPGETRCNLLEKNTKILHSIATQLGTLKSSAIVLLVTNPVDILTHIAYDIFNLPSSQIFGTGTLLDSARLRWRIAEHFHINIKNVHGYVLGEHGDTEFVAWSTVKTESQLTQKEKEEIEESVKKAAYEIISGKGATYFGISAATTKLLNAILNDTHEIFPVSTIYPHSKNPYVLKTPLGIPAIICQEGIRGVPEIKLSEKETEQLEASAKKLQELYCSCPL